MSAAFVSPREYEHRQGCKLDHQTLGHGPRLEDTAELQPQIVVQPRGGMLLEDEPQPFRRRNLAGPLGSSVLTKSRLASFSASFELAKSSSIQSSSIQSSSIQSERVRA